MREKMLGISRRLRELGETPGIEEIQPGELLEEIADIIDQELKGNTCQPVRPSIGARAMGLDTIKREQS